MEAAATQTPESTADVTAAPAVTTTVPSSYDPFGGYPNNPKRKKADSFVKLQKTNPDICGWITIGNDLDQAVVQRDNEYYLRRDYTTKHNANGAIFLDEQVELFQRPTCYIPYGHNMKTGAMFGMLQKYDDISYLRDHAVITFNTQYEDGQFAVFATGIVSLEPSNSHFADYFNLPHAESKTREQIIARLQKISEFRIPLDVSSDDQLLILVTCAGDDSERRFVAARRMREGEKDG